MNIEKRATRGKAKAKTGSRSRRRRGSGPSGVTVRVTRDGGIHMRAYGPRAPDLRTVVPEMFGDPGGAAAIAGDEDDECRTCRGEGMIRDGETRELRRCLDCGGSGSP